ncbi:hypothetical protein BRADO3427 [Bradyrhizobium sp. ORS 278]|uniref:hypothetical protein n=1 Tax=Bradyrhizobium sp. (strain ORS 278) TaxID=114615 RepID=UPI0001508552|nr:hypothetical protein [Bradyrhizobium sp. ORS 278]CAL77215.1 hypothetical protein BRADO3427 [Bradyrhizobium sp. ORS 278]
MVFFKRELSPVEIFERALKDKQATRQRLAERLRVAELAFEEKRIAAERLAKAGASNGQLDRAESKMQVVEQKAKALRAAVGECDEQIILAERALAEAIAQRDRDRAANEIEAVASAIEQAVPRFEIGAAALVDAVTRGRAALTEASRFAADVDDIRREVLSAAELICWELRAAATRTRAGNINVALLSAPELRQLPPPETDRQMIYTLNPLTWREGEAVKRVAAFTMTALPKALLPLALAHQHVDYLNARRVQTLMHVHGSGPQQSEPLADDPALIDLDALGAPAEETQRADVA